MYVCVGSAFERLPVGIPHGLGDMPLAVSVAAIGRRLDPLDPCLPVSHLPVPKLTCINI